MARIVTPTVIIDTREIRPFPFNGTGFKTKSKRMRTGDYTLVGLENRLCIERKGSVEELYSNLCGSDKERRRQLSVFERMQEFQHRYLVLEASASDLLHPNPYMAIPPTSFLNTFLDTVTRFNLTPIFLGRRSGRSLQVFYSLLNTIWKQWCEGVIK